MCYAVRMVRQVNIHEAKTHFSELIAAVERGEEVAIARRGKVVAVLAAPRPKEKHKPRFGLFKDKITIHPSFDDPLTAEELEDWYAPLEGLEELSARGKKRTHPA